MPHIPRNLEEGDGIYIRYRIQSYAYGRMAREFWDKCYFNYFVPVDHSRYCLLTVKNEVMEIGELSTFKVPFYFSFVRADVFRDEERIAPVSYWEYEDCDQYDDDITLELPTGKQFTELPKAVNLSFQGLKYSLQYEQKAPGTLRVLRHITTDRSNIPAGEYLKFQEFVDAVVNAESKFIAFK
jgi:hypothetical protein